MRSIVECCDCMKFMARFSDGFFDLAIVDPPYFKGVAKDDYFNSRVKNTRKENKGNVKFWDFGIPTRKYYDELKRVSDNQIIWGCNYYSFLQPVGRIVWDKVNDNTPFSDCELASINLMDSVKIFRYKWNGMIQQDMKHKEKRIHLTQKPIALYIWLLQNYAKPGDKILDTHLGSQSSRIAARKMGFDFWGCEIDQEYFDDGCKRYEKEAAQETLFAPQQEKTEQPNLFNEVRNGPR